MFSEANFSSGNDVLLFLQNCEKQHFATSLSTSEPICLRHGLEVTTTKDSLILATSLKKQTFTGRNYLLLADFFASHSTFTQKNLSDHMLNAGIDIFETIAIIQQLFDQGIFQYFSSKIAL